MPRLDKRVHYIYKIVCTLNQKFYIGMHSTNNLEDGYFGSGKILKRSLNKYGKEFHTKEILEFLPDRESLKTREKELVNKSLLTESLCMNLQLGGGGGFSSESQASNFYKAGGKAVWKIFRDKHLIKLKTDSEYKLAYCKKISNSLIGRSGKNHTQEFKEKIGKINSERQLGKNNSQYGSFWITN